MKTNSSLYHLIAEKFAGRITSRQEEQLQRWINSSPENQQIYEELIQILDKAELPSPPTPPDIAAEWQKLAEKLGFVAPGELHLHRFPGVEESASPSRWSWREMFQGGRRAYGLVAAILLVAGILYFLKQTAAPPEFLEVHTIGDHKEVLLLPDGTQVQLNHHSRLRYPRNFAEASSRRVFLEGEAYFDVMADPEHPFVVETGYSRVEVRGTRFDVWNREDLTRVVVEEGTVVLVSAPENASPAEVTVTAGRMSRCARGLPPQPPEQVDVNMALGWREGRLAFYRATLREIAAELENRYGIPIDVQVSHPEQYTVTGTFEDQSVEEVISSICLTLNLEYIKGDRRIVIKQ